MKKETTVGKGYIIDELRVSDQWSLKDKYEDHWEDWSQLVRNGESLLGFRDWLITRLDEDEIDIKPEVGARRKITVELDLTRAESDAEESALREIQERIHAVISDEYMPNGHSLHGYDGPLVTRINSQIEDKR